MLSFTHYGVYFQCTVYSIMYILKKTKNNCFFFATFMPCNIDDTCTRILEKSKIASHKKLHFYTEIQFLQHPSIHAIDSHLSITL